MVNGTILLINDKFNDSLKISYNRVYDNKYFLMKKKYRTRFMGYFPFIYPLFLNKSEYTCTICINCRKIYNLFVQALETGRKASSFIYKKKK